MPHRHRARLFLFATVVSAVAAAIACGPSRYEEATLALVNVNVITMRSETVLENQMVVVGGDRILAVEPSDPRRLPPGARQVEGDGAYVIPGLTDMHVHVLSSPDDALQRALPLMVANGVTTVRDMGSELSSLTAVRERWAGTDLAAPRLFAAGPLLDGTLKPWYGKLPLILETPEQAREQLPRLRDAGVDFFKIYDDLSAETYAAIAEEARSSGLQFAGHVPASVPIVEAVAAGQRTIEHLGLSTVKDCVDDPGDWFQRAINARFGEGYDAYYGVVRDHWDSVDWSKCAAVFAAMAEPGVYFTPTLDMELNDRNRLDPDTIRYMLPQSRGWCDSVRSGIDGADATIRAAAFKRHLAAFGRMRDAGVTLLAGSDTPNNCVVAGFSLHWELALLVEAGLSPFEALRAGTVDAARALGFEEIAGTVEPGRQADLVLLEGSPLEDITNSRRIAGVVAQGRWLDRDALDKLLAGALDAAQGASPDGS